MRNWSFIVVALAGCLAGCAAPAREKAPTRPAVTAEAARGVRVLRGDGSAATWQDVVHAASASDAVILGENHGHPLGLAAAAALWEDVLASSPKAVLEMEFFERDEQAHLDDFHSGVTDIDGLAKALRRDEQSFPPGHRRMVQLAKDAKRPVLAANAARRYVRLAKSDGFDRLRSLGPEQQRLFRVPDSLPTDRYRTAFDEVMNANAGVTEAELKDAAFMEKRKPALDAAFRSQSVWDWTMSQSVVRGIELGTPVMLVVGRFHCDHEGGLVQALRKQKSEVKVLVVSFVDVAAPTAGLRDEDKSRGDFVVYVGSAE